MTIHCLMTRIQSGHRSYLIQWDRNRKGRMQLAELVFQQQFLSQSCGSVSQGDTHVHTPNANNTVTSNYKILWGICISTGIYVFLFSIGLPLPCPSCSFNLLIDVAISATSDAGMLLDHTAVKVIDEAKVHGIFQSCVPKINQVFHVPATRDSQSPLQRLLVLPDGKDAVHIGMMQPEHGLVGGVIKLLGEVIVSKFGARRRCNWPDLHRWMNHH